MPKKKRAAKRRPEESASELPPITHQTVARLEKLADNLEEASKEAAAVAELARNELAEELSAHLVDRAAANTDPKTD